jgi:hypothetical protein
MKRILKWLGIVVLVVLVAAAGYVGSQVYAFNKSMDKVYDVPPPKISRSPDAQVAARGRHVAESIAGCAGSDCHGADLAGGKPIVMGPLGTVVGPNITPAGRVADYSDGELARLILHGIKKDGRSVVFMPSQDINWLPDEEVQAVITYLRSVPPVTKADGKSSIGVLAKVLDRRGLIQIDVAKIIDHGKRVTAPAPTPTASYGAYLGRLCVGCHGEHLAGGKIPGAPASIPVPANITPHETGLKGWTYEDFDRLLVQGLKKDGKKLDPFMPVEAFGKMNDIEKKALWAHLQSVPPVAFGGR